MTDRKRVCYPSAVRPGLCPVIGLAAAGVLAGCTPVGGDYLLSTVNWSTQCAVGSGPYSVPAAQYAIDVSVGEAEVWLDGHACARDGLAYVCDDEPTVTPLDDAGYNATVTIRRAWTGTWVDLETLKGTVEYTPDCEGPDCYAVTTAGVELCGAIWDYSAVAVEWE
jgi:hypothetical protein